MGKKKVIPDSLKRQLCAKAIMDKINKDRGAGSVTTPRTTVSVAEVIPTGIIPLDIALGVGGIPCGRVVEIYGPESSGKTTLALHIVAEAQRLGHMAAVVDAEHALDIVYAANIGVDMNELLISQPSCGEEGLDLVDTFVKEGVKVVVVDSVAALVPRVELDGEMGASHIGLQARLMSQALRKLTGHIGRSGAVVIFINQLRMKIGGYGNPEVTTGGNALKFYASIRLSLSKGTAMKGGDTFLGRRPKITVVKNKVAAPYQFCEPMLASNGKGFDRCDQLLSIGEEAGIITKSGNWFNYGEAKLGNGHANAMEFLRNAEDIRQDIENEVAVYVESAYGVKLRGEAS